MGFQQSLSWPSSTSRSSMCPLKCNQNTFYDCRGEWVSLLVGQSVHLKSRAPFSFISHFLYFLSIFSLDYINSAYSLEKCSSPLFCNSVFIFPSQTTSLGASSPHNVGVGTCWYPIWLTLVWPGVSRKRGQQLCDCTLFPRCGICQ